MSVSASMLAMTCDARQTHAGGLFAWLMWPFGLSAFDFDAQAIWWSDMF